MLGALRFRPLLGAYFFMRIKEALIKAGAVSVPYLGLIFLSGEAEYIDVDAKFPSPTWGLFFYRNLRHR